MGSHRPHAPAGETTREATAARRAASGERCQEIFPSGRRCIATIAHWVKRGLWESINALLVEQVPTQSGRTEQPSLGMIDSQSIKRAQRGQIELGFDGHKKLKGRKRHVVVDVLGLMLGCYVSAANAADSKAALKSVSTRSRIQAFREGAS